MAVLRLHNWLEFVRDVVAKKHQIILRDGPCDQKLNDRVFEHEMRKAIKESDLAYSKLLFKDALKGFDSTIFKKIYKVGCGLRVVTDARF